MSFQPGDVLGFRAYGCLGFWIAAATWLDSPDWLGRGLSHVGYVIDAHDSTGNLLIAEATSLVTEPCYFSGAPVKGVQTHLIASRLAGYRGRIWRYPIKHRLTTAQSRHLTRYVLDHVGDDYDTLGAFRSRCMGFGWIERRLGVENLSSIFCSEWSAASFREIGLFATINASKWNPNAFCREIYERGTHGKRERVDLAKLRAAA